MKSVIILPKSDRAIFKSILSILSDPFYYLLNLNSLILLLFFSMIIVSILASIMMAIWILVKLIAVGILHSPSDAPVKMFFGMAVITIFTTIAGIIHRHLTRSEVRGQFVSFSKYMTLRNQSSSVIEEEDLLFQVVDKRATQLIGMGICAEVAIDHGRGDFEFRRVAIDSPGMIVLPTQIPIHLENIFPEILHANCDVCGATCTAATLAAHLQYFHEIDKKGSLESRKIKMHTLISSIHEIRIRISGVDEVSGKPGTAEHLYEKSNIILVQESKEKLHDDFDTVTTTVDDMGDSSTIERSISSPSAKSSSPKKFVHVDFNYQ